MSERRLIATRCPGLLAVVCLVIAPLHGHGAAPFATRERLHKPQGPLVEKALADLADKAEELEHTLLVTHMTHVLAEMRDPLDLTPQETAALAAPAEEAVNEAVKTWKPCVAASLRPILVKYGDDKGQAERVATWTASQLVPTYVVEKWTLPEWLPQWDKAVESQLGPERAARWKTLRAEKRKAALPAIDQFLQNWAEIGRKRLDAPLEANIRLLQKATRLSEEDAQKLSKQARKLVDDHVALEKASGRDMLISMPDEPRKAFLAGKTMASRFVVPTEEELEQAWLDLAGKVAGDTGLQAWKAAKAEEKEALAERHREILKPSKERARTQMDDQISQEIERLAGGLNLDAERRKKLEDLGRKAVAACLNTVVKGWMKQAEGWTEEYIEARKNTLFYVSSTNHPMREPLWQEGVKKLFSEDELKQAEQSTEDRKTRARFALARAALADIDQLLSLTAEQRRVLEPLLAPQMTSFIRGENASSWRVETQQLQTAARLPERQIRGILDEVQTKKWLKLGQKEPGQERLRAAVIPNAAPPRPGRSPAEAELEVAAEISRHLHKRSLKQRAENLNLMQAQVEDVHRTVNLASEKLDRLTLAAKGAVEADMIAWRQNLENWTHQQVPPDTSPEAVKVILANLEASSNFSLFFTNMNGPDTQNVWMHTLNDVLSATEHAAWDKVVAERKAYRVRALAGMAVVELDRRRGLAPQQCARLEKILADVVDENLPDIESSMSYRSSPWHLSYYSCLMPLAGAKTADLQEVLTPAQWKLVKSQDMMDSERYWRSVESRRKLRQQMQRGNAIMPAPLFFFAP